MLKNLDHQEDRRRGADLITRARAESGETDLEILAGGPNLQQALLLRFLTHAGELAVLGHPDYGSRLHLLIGERNTEATRNRAKLYVLEALQAEPRVKDVLSVDVIPSRKDRTQVDIDMKLRTIVSDTPLNLVFPFFLEESAPS
ncbi:MAG TPA: hypothetical protein VFF17_10515 [Thermoanaerobaculia bacterium]|nr:hypothetical protein [Thermoanaerobaculia bacterium]